MQKVAIRRIVRAIACAGSSMSESHTFDLTDDTRADILAACRFYKVRAHIFNDGRLIDVASDKFITNYYQSGGIWGYEIP